ncbi:indole-3-glycerol phosphate synthase TrpC [Granulicella tundricola]|uniref:Indole-3-glycerol phosphate synthase n=1 Tax=Granulicella tundricola (strain ATCC BAA-1859 / DSM 23138 / MP5ACTX9) TaxID=1198114 RepID=E8X4R3_GRATM|nr:indole-3-glycerol phosphate synthase TrpC [Granulicella tundricola]ADW70552.1 Indole-3-glycerol-phosphate synthase [Granulicella tundricola MP5ACTX9]
MSTVLDKILARTTLSVQARQAAADLPALERRAAAHIPAGFAANLRAVAQTRPAVIAELKKASPSKGLIREDFRPTELAASLEAAGAAALSVLTDEEFFQGSLAYLEAARAAVRIPLLRKDFMVAPFQFLEARAAGADAILLIVAAHDDATLKILAASARQYQLDILCEVHDREELERAKDLGADLIGVNARDLKTLDVKHDNHMALIEHLPADTIRVAESGIRTPADIDRLLAAGYNAFLIGETLMREPDPAAVLATLLGTAATV